MVDDPFDDLFTWAAPTHCAHTFNDTTWCRRAPTPGSTYCAHHEPPWTRRAKQARFARRARQITTIITPSKRELARIRHWMDARGGADAFDEFAKKT